MDTKTGSLEHFDLNLLKEKGFEGKTTNYNDNRVTYEESYRPFYISLTYAMYVIYPICIFSWETMNVVNRWR